MNRFFSFIILSLFTAGFQAYGYAEADAAPPSTASPAPAPVLVEIDGVKLTLGDFSRKHPGGLFHASESFYEAEHKVVEGWIDEYLLERQAQKEHVTVPELLKIHIESAGDKQPSEEALRVYYDGIDTQQSYESLRQQIIDHLREGRITKARTAYMSKLRSEAHISFQFGAPRAPVSLKDTPVRGPANAQVVIVEFSDYECPYCQNVQAAVAKIEADYKGKIAFAYKDFPLPGHPHAQKASEAAHCAEDQGKFWEYHDLLFKSRALDVPQLKEHARELKLDADAFDKCLDSGAKAGIVKDRFNEGAGFTVPGTPTFFINGHQFSAVLDVPAFHQVIDEEMAVAAATTRAVAAQAREAGQGTETAKR
jgi:predicted DsbA family dithiol-disulfide isomerase